MTFKPFAPTFYLNSDSSEAKGSRNLDPPTTSRKARGSRGLGQPITSSEAT